jgi:hypothetical protein
VPDDNGTEHRPPEHPELDPAARDIDEAAEDGDLAAASEWHRVRERYLLDEYGEDVALGFAVGYVVAGLDAATEGYEHLSGVRDEDPLRLLKNAFAILEGRQEDLIPAPEADWDAALERIDTEDE